LAQEGVEVAALVTAPPRRSGRGRKEAVNPLVEMAQAAGVAVLRPELARDEAFVAEFASLQADLGIVVSYGQILPQALLDALRFGCVNIHGSLLPRWRGASPVQAAILAGDVQTGVCVQQMVAALDAGDVLAERRCEIGPRETGPELFERLRVLGAALLTEFLSSFVARGLPAAVAQDVDAVTFCRKVKKRDGAIDWSCPASEIDALVRAYAGWPCGQTVLPNGDGLKIHQGEVCSEAGPFGVILSINDGILVACGQDSFRIVELQRQGKGPMLAGDFLRGMKLEVGAKLG